MSNKPTYEELEKRVRELERVESELQDNLALLKEIFNQPFHFIAVLTPEGRVLEVNAPVLKMQGWSRDECIGHLFWELPAWRDFPEWQERIHQRIIEAQSMHEPLLTESIYQAADGALRYLDASCTAIRGLNGSVKHLLIQASDITKYKKIVNGLKKSEEEYRKIYENSVVGFFRSTPEGRFTKVNTAFARMLGYDSPEDLISSISDIASQYYMNQSDRAQYQALLKKTGTIENYEFKARCKDGAPIWVSNSTRAYFNAKGAPIQYEGIVIDITERKQVELERNRLLSQLQTTLDSTADGILTVDNTGKIVSFNKRFVKMWRIPDPIIESHDDNKALSFVLDQLKDPEGFLKKVKELYNDPDARSFDTLEFKDGSVFERFSLPQKLDDKNIGRVWSFRDVTARKKMETTLKESEAKYRMVLKANPDPVAVYNLKGEVIYLNIAFTQVFGWRLEELIGKKIENFVPGENWPETEMMIETVRRGESFSGIETMRFSKEGNLIPVSISGSPLKNSAGEVLFSVANIRDITERKRFENALVESERKFRSISASVHDAMLTVNNKGAITFWNKGAKKIFGYHEAEVIGKNLHLLLAPTKYLDAVEKGLMRFAVDGKGVAIGKTLELSALRKNGAEFPIELSLASYQIEGKWHAVGTIRDISDRKRAEQEREKMISDLQKALRDVKQLSGLLPICSHCKKVRDDKGYWNQIEAYIAKHSGTAFSHGICPECAKKYYPDMELYDD
jgi:PAS domain S-box-containing protein